VRTSGARTPYSGRVRTALPAPSARRGFDRTVLTGALPLLAILPVWAVALVPFWLIAAWLTGVGYTAFAVGHVATSLFLFVKPVQVVVIGGLLGARRPDRSESARLDTAWRSVLQANGLNSRRFVLMILPSEELNAFACGGHLVVVTSFAVDTLPRDELSGVLAHELSHHLGLHTGALTITQWLSVPVWLLARLGFFLNNVATAATRSVVSHSAALTAIARLVGAVLTLIAWVFLIGLWLSNAVANTVGKRAEFMADRRAIEMGFGKPLASALRRVTLHATRPTTFRERLASSHPSARLRVARIEALLRAHAYPQRAAKAR
jgi:Zn-dependent protease with chaperone function